MKLKKYIEFLNENSIGEWVESLIDDEYVRDIVSRYTKDSSADINLSNAINVLDDKTKSDIKYQIDQYLENGIEEKDPVVVTSTDTEKLLESSDEITLSGKSIFTSFLKSLTALGQKMKDVNWDNCPDNFLLFYYYPDLDSEVTKSIFNRFRSLSRHSNVIDYDKNETNLFFGVKCDGDFEYGVMNDGKLVPIGKFKLSKSVIKWITLLESKSAHFLKKELVNLSYEDILLLGKIKKDMIEFMPGVHEERGKTILKDRVLSFSYLGLKEDLNTIKNKFNNWLVNKKWTSKILISLTQNENWIFIKIKIK